MNKRTAIYLRQYPCSARTDQELTDNLAQAIEDRGDILIDTHIDDGRITGRGKNSGWRRLLADLDSIEQIVLADPGDLPGKTVTNLLSILATLTDHGVTLVVPARDLDTGTGPAAILELVRAYRRAKLSQAIKTGLDRAKAAGKHVGRPTIPDQVRRRIAADLAGGGSVRGVARRHGVSGGSVINIRRSLAATVAEAA